MRLLALLLLLLAACAAPPAVDTRAADDGGRGPDFDVLVRGGTVIDGSGAPSYRADIGVRGDTIIAVGNLSGRTATVVLDATGHVVSPGFIDLLGNSQSAVLIDPNLEGKIRQGVTTEVTGEGTSPGPISEAMRAEMERTKPPGWPAVDWTTLGDFMNVVRRRGTALNFAFYVGATNPRQMILGDANRAPDARELGAMKDIVAQARNEGAVGLASALIYAPGRFATTHELTEMSRVAGSYWTHLRNEGGAIDEAIDEALKISGDAGVPLNIFHLKVGGRENWGRMAAIVTRLGKEIAAGRDIASCVYPYTATSTALTSIVPAWALEGGYAAFVTRLADPQTRARIADALRTGRLANNGASTIVVRGVAESMKPYESKRLDAIAREMNVDAAEAALRLFAAGSTPPIGIYFSLDENDMKRALVQPWIAICSDSGAVVGEARKSGAHPRAYGTFPRVLRYVREEKLMTLEQAIRKMTALAAERARLADRGVLRERMKADIVVFDAQTVRDVSTYEDPHHFAEGIRHVVVNGTPVLRDGRMTGALPGRILKPAAK